MGVALAIVLATTSVAAGDSMSLLDQAWPRVPDHRGPSLAQRLTDTFSDLGNELGRHMHTLSGDRISMRFDGRQRRASFRVATGDPRYFTFVVATDIQFTGALARVRTRIDFSVHGRKLKLELPDFEMMPQSYQGDRIVVLLVPFFERRW
ncbi:MAG: hypothetical protein H0T79_18230 [Deltaproteobacteria bacterium]|nr:hypothetical protein [Deltaproteobacteria bacterium]